MFGKELVKRNCVWGGSQVTSVRQFVLSLGLSFLTYGWRILACSLQISVSCASHLHYHELGYHQTDPLKIYTVSSSLALSAGLACRKEHGFSLLSVGTPIPWSLRSIMSSKVSHGSRKLTCYLPTNHVSIQLISTGSHLTKKLWS